MRKLYIYMCSALLICGNASAYFGGYSAYDLYQYASSGDFRTLRDAASNINATDSNGQTAICYAINNRDYVAYKNLVMVKADEHPECVKHMNKQDYEDFKRGYEMRGGKISTSFSLGGSTTAWTVAGIAAVGAGVAIAAGGGGGGGGGGSSDTPEPTPTPTPAPSCESYNLSACLPNAKCEECVGATRSYFKLVGCNNGYVMNPYNTGCIPDSSVAQEYPLLECDANGWCASAMSGDVKRYKLMGCNEGYEMDVSGLACVPICDGYTKMECDFYTQYVSEKCSRDEAYHKCADRAVTDHCSNYETDADRCTACYGKYKINNGVCEQICKNYTTVPCENNTQYQTEVCSDDPNYHKCATRTNKNCAGYVVDKDECSACNYGYSLINGACVSVCEGYTQDDCLENQYISEQCDVDKSYHKCKDRTITEGCQLKDPYADKCISCNPGYKLNDGVCEQICVGYTNKACTKGTQYISGYCSDDPNFHICTNRTNTDGCSDYEVDKDRCTGCHGGYSLEDGKCISACPGYTQNPCATLEYKAEDCVNDPSFHICKARNNTNACSKFDPNADKCTECVDGYSLNNGTCQLTCPGYTKTECPINTEYEDKYCSQDSRYHTCTPRKNLIGCVEFSKTSDDCTLCNGTSTEPVDGKCECKGYITESCDKKTQYISSECATAAGYHTCSEREHTEGCKTFNEYSDTCLECEKANYYLPESGICTLRERIDGCKIFNEFSDTCLECEKANYYLPESGICTPRENTDNCKTYSVTEDKCLTCAENYKVVDGFCVAMCKGYQTTPCDNDTHYSVSDCADEKDVEETLKQYHRCVERTYFDGCDKFSPSSDTCVKCDDDHTLNGEGKCDKNSTLCPGYTTSECNLETQYMPTETIGGVAPTCQYDDKYHRCVSREVNGCATYDPNYDKCASCKDGQKLVDGKCEGLCPGYQKEECNNKYYYNTGETCEDDPSYHECKLRENTMYCTEFSPTKDECTDCKDGYEVNSKGECEQICPGFKQECGSGWHVAKDGSGNPITCSTQHPDYYKCELDPDAAYIPGCKDLTEDKQNCKTCEDFYYLSGGKCSPWSSEYSDNCSAPQVNQQCCTGCGTTGYEVQNCKCVFNEDLIPSGEGGGGGSDTPSGGGGSDTPSGGGGDTTGCTSASCSKDKYEVKGSCEGDEHKCVARSPYPISDCDTYATDKNACEICENGYGIGDNTGSNTPNSSGLCPSQDGSDCISGSCPSGQHSYTEGCSSGHRCTNDIANCDRYDAGDGLCDDCKDGYNLSSDRKSCTSSGSGGSTVNCDGVDLSKCTPYADCDLRYNYYGGDTVHTCCTSKYSTTMVNPVYCAERQYTSDVCVALAINGDICEECTTGAGVNGGTEPDVNGRCLGDVGWTGVSAYSGKVVKVFEVTEDKTKGQTLFVALNNKLDTFNAAIAQYNGNKSDTKQKIVIDGEHNKAVDITGAINIHNGSAKGGTGTIEITRSPEDTNPITGAVKGLVGGNNHTGSQVAIDLNVKDGFQDGRRSFIAGMGKEVGAYRNTAEEVNGIDLGTAEYGQHNQTLTNAGSVDISAGGTAPVFGMLGLRQAGNVANHSENQNLGDFENSATGTIDINAPQAAEVYGIRVNNLINKDGLGSSYANVTNNGKINIVGGSDVYGIAAKNANIYNNGNIDITATGDNVYGIYADSSNVVNNGNITVNAAGDNAYGIYAVNNSSVKNNGIININGDESAASIADGKFIKVDKGSYVINANTIISNASLDTGALGGGDILMTKGSNITAPDISGKLTLSSDITTGSNQNTYTLQNMINGNVQDLELVSQSAMFKASMTEGENGIDGTLTRNSFNELIKNSSLADYLEKNYEAGNASALFDSLKNIQTINKLKSGINDLFGQKMLPRMTFEDMSMMREINLDMNKNMFKQEGAFSFGGNVSPYSYDNNVGSVGRYALHGFNNGKNSYALGISISDVNTYDDDKENSRSDRSFVMSAPLGHKTHGFEFITTPKIGYAYGEYTRNGFNTSYKGKVYKRMYALMNEARYPINVGKMSFTPSAEFNMIGFNVKSSEDANRPYNLRIPSQNHYSVEAGVGLMAEKEFSWYKLHRFKLNAGVAFYHEFANPYELDIRMSELDGTYRLHDEKRHSNRVAARFGFDYELKKDIDVSMSMLSNIDGECRTDAVCDIKYHF